MPASVCQKLTSAMPINLQDSMWSDRSSADGTDIGGTLYNMYLCEKQQVQFFD